MNNDLISREALKEASKEKFDDFIPEGVYDEIDNAPSVDIKDEIAGAYNEGYMCGNKEAEKARPQGEYEFIEILAQYVPDDICIYPEYKGKPYYSIHYKQNGEEFVGFGTYNPEVLSRYLKEYFMKGGAE